MTTSAFHSCERPAAAAMDRSLDPPPHATHSPPRLRDVALAMLRLHWPGPSSPLLTTHPAQLTTVLAAVRDVGDAPYALLQTLLPLSSASQLADLEQNSPHLVPHTNPIWRQLCVNEFIEVRKAVEDGHISQQDEPESWKEQYDLEAIKREVSLSASPLLSSVVKTRILIRTKTQNRKRCKPSCPRCAARSTSTSMAERRPRKSTGDSKSAEKSPPLPVSPPACRLLSRCDVFSFSRFN